MKRGIIVGILCVLVLGLFFIIKTNLVPSKNINEKSSVMAGLDLQTIASQSDGVFTGTVLKISQPYLVAVNVPGSPPGSSGEFEVYQSASIDVDRWIYNPNNLPNNISITWLGGQIDINGTMYSRETMASIDESERVLAFVYQTSDINDAPLVSPVGNWQGIFHLAGTDGVSKSPDDGEVKESLTIDQANALFQ